MTKPLMLQLIVAHIGRSSESCEFIDVVASSSFANELPLEIHNFFPFYGTFSIVIDSYKDVIPYWLEGGIPIFGTSHAAQCATVDDPRVICKNMNCLRANLLNCY